jgi:hypothetical protein
LPRQGYYLAGGFNGVMVSSEHQDAGRIVPSGGGGLSLRLGEMVTSWLGFGFEGSFATISSHRWQQEAGGLLLEMQLVPWRHLSVRMGAGVGFVQARDDEEIVTGTQGTGGASFAVGVAYDFFPFYTRGSGGWGITPAIGLKYFPGDTFHTVAVWAGIECTWWLGLDKQELELPVEEAFRRAD